MTIPIFQVDAFTSNLFGGNPAAVCVLDQWLADDLMQSIAAENNLSETAFLVKHQEGYEIRWFTPAVEVALCGHATLASAYVLFQFYRQTDHSLTFDSKSGPLTVTRNQEQLTLNFPADPASPSSTPDGLEESLGIRPLAVFKGKTDYLILLNDEQSVLSLNPDFKKLAQVQARGVIVTAPGDSHDFVSRFFAPASGVDEDPVTGSAHCTLAPFWYQKTQKNPLFAYQCSQRGGMLTCTMQDNRILLTGNAKLYLKGEIYID